MISMKDFIELAEGLLIKWQQQISFDPDNREDILRSMISDIAQATEIIPEEYINLAGSITGSDKLSLPPEYRNAQLQGPTVSAPFITAFHFRDYIVYGLRLGHTVLYMTLSGRSGMYIAHDLFEDGVLLAGNGDSTPNELLIVVSGILEYLPITE